MIFIVYDSESDLDYGQDNTVPLEKHDEQQEEKKLFVISSSNASAKPFAMMIEVMSAVTTEIAMKCSLWPIDEASVTVFHPC